jgi:hypothetical protein
MPSILPFDNIVVNSVAIPASEFVSGKGTLNMIGNDVAVTTADGRIHNVRQAISSDASCELYGDKTARKTTAPSLSVPIVLKRGTATVASFNGIVAVTYNESSKTSSVSIKGDPTVS